MSEDFYRSFDYYNAEPPRESVAPPPEEACSAVPEDEYNEQVHVSKIPRRKAKSIAFMLAISGLATSFVFPGVGLLQAAQDITEESSVIESSISGSENGANNGTPAETTLAPTPTPTPAPTPTPVPTEDLRLRLDSVEFYTLDKGFLAEIKFTLSTNCGIGLSSITGSIDSKLFIYDGYDFKKNKMKSHYEDFYKEFSMDTAKAVIGDSSSSTEKQYVIYVPIEAGSSEDKFNVTLTVSNTLNGQKTEDKTATLKDIALWNDETDTYASSMFTLSATRNADKSFDVTINPKDGFDVSDPKINSVLVFGGKNSTAYFETKDFNVSYQDGKIHIEFKKPNKAPSSGTLQISTFANFQLTDSNGTTHTGKAYRNLNLKY